MVALPIDVLDCKSGRVETEEVVAEEPELDAVDALVAFSRLWRRPALWAEKVLVASYSARSRSRSTTSIAAVELASARKGEQAGP